MPSWGVCNLSSINLSKFVDDNDVDWGKLREIVHISVRFLDNVIDATSYYFQENEENQKKERRIGLGTMGLAEMLIKLGIKYGSDKSLEFLDEIYRFIAEESYLASMEIAKEKGAFPAFEFDKFLYNYDADMNTFAGNLFNGLDKEDLNALETYGIRNATILTQAPVGSTGTMVGTSTGIEPYFAFEYLRQSRLGLDKQYVPIAQEWLNNHPNQQLPGYFVGAMDLSAEDHVKVQGAIQKWVDSSISKTANAPSDFTVEDTKKLYELAYELGCKGVTIYRDGSRDEQVLSTEKKEDKKVEEQPKPKQITKRPHRLDGATYKFKTPVGTAYININNDENGKPMEVIVNVGKAGSAVAAMAEALGRTSTLFLRFGELPDKKNPQLLIDHLSGIGGSEQVMGFGIKKADSIPDAIARALKEHLSDTVVKVKVETEVVEETTPELNLKGLDFCPECNNFTLVNEDGCKHCISCGYSKCS